MTFLIVAKFNKYLLTSHDYLLKSLPLFSSGFARSLYSLSSLLFWGDRCYMRSYSLLYFLILLPEPVEDILLIEGKKEFAGTVGVFRDFQFDIFCLKVLFVFRGVGFSRFSCQGLADARMESKTKPTCLHNPATRICSFIIGKYLCMASCSSCVLYGS